MNANTKKYLTFAAVLLAVAVSGWAGARYLQSVRENVVNAYEASPEGRALESSTPPAENTK